MERGKLGFPRVESFSPVGAHAGGVLRRENKLRNIRKRLKGVRKKEHHTVSEKRKPL